MAGFVPTECRSTMESMAMTKRCSLLLTGVILVCGCTQPAPKNGPANPKEDATFVVTGDQKADWQRILQLEEQAKAIINTGGCTSADQCRSAPVGSRACGGPRYYLVYCARTTDSAALFRKLEDVAAAERAYNVRYQIMSTCEFRMPPELAIAGGVCAAK
jgi:hypothetical protein